MFANAADMGSFFSFDFLRALKGFFYSGVQSPVEPSLPVVSRYAVQLMWFLGQYHQNSKISLPLQDPSLATLFGDRFSECHEIERPVLKSGFWSFLSVWGLPVWGFWLLVASSIVVLLFDACLLSGWNPLSYVAASSRRVFSSLSSLIAIMGVSAHNIRRLVSREDLDKSMSMVDERLARQVTDQREVDLELRNSRQGLENGHANLLKELRQLEGSTKQAIDSLHGAMTAKASVFTEDIVGEIERVSKSCSNLKDSLDSFKEATAESQDKVNKRFQGTHEKIDALNTATLGKIQKVSADAEKNFQSQKTAINDTAKDSRDRMNKHVSFCQKDATKASEGLASIRKSHDELQSQVNRHKSSNDDRVGKACKDSKAAKVGLDAVDKRLVALEKACGDKVAASTPLDPSLTTALVRIDELKRAAKEDKKAHKAELELAKGDSRLAIYHVNNLFNEFKQFRESTEKRNEETEKRIEERDDAVMALCVEVFYNSNPDAASPNPVSPAPDVRTEASGDNALTCQSSTQATEQGIVEPRATSSARPVETGSVATDRQAQPSSFPAGEETLEGYNEQPGEQHSRLQQGEGEESASQPAPCSSNAVDATETQAVHEEDRSGDPQEILSHSEPQCSAQAIAPLTPQIASSTSAEFVPAPPTTIAAQLEALRRTPAGENRKNTVPEPKDDKSSSGKGDAAAVPQPKDTKKRRRRPEKWPHKKAQKERIELQLSKPEWDAATEEAKDEARARLRLGNKRQDWGAIRYPDIRDRILVEGVRQEALVDWCREHHVYIGVGYLPNGPNYSPPPLPASSPHQPSSGMFFPMHHSLGSCPAPPRNYSSSPLVTSPTPNTTQSHAAVQTSTTQHDDLQASIYAPPPRPSYSSPPRQSDILPVAPPNAPTGPRNMPHSRRPSASLYRPPRSRSDGHAPLTGSANVPFSTGPERTAVKHGSPVSSATAAYTPRQPANAQLQTSYHRRPQHGESEKGRLR
ncbi:MAG: hypothetical protein Q9160_008350 [Pyrenula sp. 1 TL-2023]